MFKFSSPIVAGLCLASAAPAMADITVGVIYSATGPVAAAGMAQ